MSDRDASPSSGAMADWSRANGASSTSSRDLVSPLTIRLQQVLLQSQLRSSRDSNAAVDLPLPSPGGAAGVPRSATSPIAVAVAGTPSSSSESGDEGWAVAVDSSDAIREENPLLQYINRMLMEECVDQQACLDVEVSVGALQAELAELIQTSPPEVRSNPDWRADIMSAAGHGASSLAPQASPPEGSSPSASTPTPTSLSRSPQSYTSSQQLEQRLQRSPSLKRRSHPMEQETSRGGFQMVGFFERQNLFVMDRNGIEGGSSPQQLVRPRRPPHLTLARSESYTRRWDAMGLNSALLDKLLLCGDAVASCDYETAWVFVEELRQLAPEAEGDATHRVVYYFLHALIARMSNTGPHLYSAMCKARPSISETLKAVQMILKHTPFLGLPHLYTNKIILDAVRGEKKVHIVDFGIMYGLQWPVLLQLLAERSEGPPQLRITGVDLPPRALNTHSGRIRETGARLKRCAHDWGIPSFKFRSLSSRWESVEPSMLQLRDDEVLIVNCSFKQTNLFDESVIAESPKNHWLTRVRNLKPRVFIQSLASSNFSGPIFATRFQEALVHHAAVFAAMDKCISRMLPDRRVIEQDKYGREIMNIIACEGVDRVERSEKHQQWHHRAVRAGFEVVPLAASLFEESKEFARRYNRDLTVDRDGEWLWLGWCGQIIHAYSSWRVAKSS